MYLQVYEMGINKQTAEMIDNAQQMHRVLTGLVHTARKDNDLLYRLEYRRGMPLLFVQSDTILEKHHALRQIAEANLDDLLKPYAVKGADICFSLVTVPFRKNGTKLKYFKDDAMGPADEQRKAWVTRRLEDRGLKVVTVHEGEKRSTSFVRRGSGKVEYTAYEYTVQAVVSNPQLFYDAWKKGVGREKAYGSGMFLLRSMPQ